MDARIQYARTSDGVNIAFWTVGEGRPFLYMPSALMVSSRIGWTLSPNSAWYQLIRQRHRLIRYDHRGAGLSDREVPGHELEDYMRDVDAIVERLGLESFTLFGSFETGPIAIAYAASRPECVSHLVLWCTSARGEDLFRWPRMEALLHLAREDWELFTETLSHDVFGWARGEEARAYAALLRDSSTAEEVIASQNALHGFDVTGLLGDVRCPTLILQRLHVDYPPVNVARSLASQLADARLALFEGSAISPYEEAEKIVQTIDEFLGTAAAPEAARAGGSLVTILFTDIEGSTALTQRLGDAAAREVLRRHELIVREQLKAHGGSEVKTMGDGFMASFGSTTKAVECAIAIQRAVAAPGGSPEQLRVRIGLNAGEPIAEEEDLFGTAVIIAARIAAQAKGDEILVSNVVRELVAGKGFLFADRGEMVLRGFEDPVRVYEVRWRD